MSTQSPATSSWAAPAERITPVPAEHRRLTAVDFAVLWGDLGVGLLVLAAGALLVPGLSTRDALLATLVGSLVGCALLGVAAYIAADAGVPAMVLTRAAVGLRGSALPTLLNVVQLLGWTSFEILVMAQFADRIAQHGGLPSLFPLWALLITVLCTLMALGGPLVVVRQWLAKFGLWAMIGTTLVLGGLLATRYDLGALLAAEGTGEFPFWLAVDLVVALPLSWFPLVADYNRFARSRSGSFWGTFIGYFLANVSFFALGALLLLALNTDPLGLSAALVDFLLVAGGGAALLLGAVAVLIILADETDNGFANIYSTAVSAQNLFTRVPQRTLVLAVAGAGFVLALMLRNTDYEAFLFLIGSCFVPLLGVVAADYFIVRGGRYEPDALFVRGGRYWYAGGVNLLAIGAWAVGFALYQWISPVGPVAQLAWPAFPAQIGGTIPSFAATFGLYAVLGRLAVRR